MLKRYCALEKILVVTLQVFAKSHNILSIVAEVRQFIVGRVCRFEPAIEVVAIMPQGIDEVANGLGGKIHD